MEALTKLRDIQKANQSMICLGLDLDAKRMPSEFAGSLKGHFEFAQRMIEATKDLVCAYKPNMAFYEHHGPEGLSLLRLIIERIPERVPVILDAKRGDIGNTATHYAHAIFDCFRADWVTLAPYMGYDSLKPFLDFKNKGAFVLCLTSNAGSKDFQYLNVDGKPLYRVVAEKVREWNRDNNCGLVVGATRPDELVELRGVAGTMPLLIPGVGAQGGSLEKAVLGGTNNFAQTAVINVSRSVLYASNGDDFSRRAREELLKLNSAVNALRKKNGEPRDKPKEALPPQVHSAPPPSQPAAPPQQNQPQPAPAQPEPPAQQHAHDGEPRPEPPVSPSSQQSHGSESSPDSASSGPDDQSHS
ncbi:MAG: orotidine-5'-phosphate decarboxylase [candidate division Zixibacteria bacterium]|nr:orotidine-5'-phosphate decarboxylase [candidate division Zixibacteria bacterium]